MTPSADAADTRRYYDKHCVGCGTAFQGQATHFDKTKNQGWCDPCGLQADEDTATHKPTTHEDSYHVA